MNSARSTRFIGFIVQDKHEYKECMTHKNKYLGFDKVNTNDTRTQGVAAPSYTASNGGDGVAPVG